MKRLLLLAAVIPILLFGTPAAATVPTAPTATLSAVSITFTTGDDDKNGKTLLLMQLV
ncbi:hypothetical protein [Cryptosporangium phraense]|uniref:hypothetical protein n=1 Tax=Cryptosporangium phraense TaxID=2593070 RepID=UPI00147887EC|nr:hypothetical protein [Cryptosporangium phraense]